MSIQSVGIVGAGQMGIGIAQVCALSGLHVIVQDINGDVLQRGMATISSNIDRLIERKEISPTRKYSALSLIKHTTDVAALASADFIIEAATENVLIKMGILNKIGEIARENAVIATNTSSISITKLAADVSFPERFIGMHFFNPVPIMPLVEVVSGMQTSSVTLARTIGLANQLGKKPISVKNFPGFIVNRILLPMINEAVFALQDGVATAKEIDEGMCLGANHRMGPLALADLIGLDTCLAVMETLYRDLGESKYRPAVLLREMVEGGRLGRKTKRGFFAYESIS